MPLKESTAAWMFAITILSCGKADAFSFVTVCILFIHSIASYMENRK